MNVFELDVKAMAQRFQAKLDEPIEQFCDSANISFLYQTEDCLYVHRLFSIICFKSGKHEVIVKDVRELGLPTMRDVCVMLFGEEFNKGASC